VKARREIASVPVRSARETWRAIVDLICGEGSVDRNHLEASASVMEALIADEYPAKTPIVVKGRGPRLVIYCLYGEDAMDLGNDVVRLNWNPTAGDWTLTAPCEAEDVEWMRKSLDSRGPRIKVHDAAAPPAEDDPESNDAAAAESLKINFGILGKP
jgi:hypothetical protein